MVTWREGSTNRCVSLAAALSVSHPIPVLHSILRVPTAPLTCCLMDIWTVHAWQSILGSFLDPVADKVLIGSVTITLGVQHLLSPWLVGLIVMRDVCLMAGVAIIRWRTRPQGAPFFSLSHAKTFEIKPSTSSKVLRAGPSPWTCSECPPCHPTRIRCVPCSWPYMGDVCTLGA